MRRSVRNLLLNDSGAVAPTLALSLIALIAAGGIAFDYARMASLDTELQNAADQATLAAASQLDGQPGACARAAAAASSMISNLTYMANEAGGTTAITVANEGTCDATGKIRFYQDKAKSSAATLDENAKFVEVQVDSRTAFFALTPVVAALSSGPIYAQAFAGIGEAICRVPPLMMCNPDELGDPDFTVANYIGKGIRLVANDGGGNYGPGVFGFLEVGAGNGANTLKAILGRNGDPGNCAEGNGVDIEPGNMIAVRDALNTRFDMYASGLNQPCGSNGELCPPSINTRKDLVKGGSGCGFVTGGTNGWLEPTNVYPGTTYPAGSTPTELNDAEIANVAPMGYPRDICHAFSVIGTCTGGLIGTGTWDRYAYFKSRSTGATPEYPEVSALQKTDVAAFEDFLDDTFNTTTPTRFQVYKYEMANIGTRLQNDVPAGSALSHGEPVCAASGVTPGANQIDRRILSVAVLNCEAEDVGSNSTEVPVTKWIDIFLTEPSVPRQRTENHDVYVEVVGESANNVEGINFQTVKKSIPYLIE